MSVGIAIGVMLTIIFNTSGLPLKKEDLPNAMEIKFFQKFGYLEPSDPMTEALYKQDAVIEAVKQMQNFGGIPVTGRMDNLTRDLMQKPRCGVPDVIRPQTNETTSGGRRERRYIIASQGWSRRHLSYFLANWTPKLGSREVILSELSRAFKVWSEYSPMTFTFQEDNINADIVVAFARGPHGDGYPFDGMGNTLAHAYFPYDFGAYGGDVHFDDDEDWTVGPGDGVDFFTVAAHELGHSLGLAHSPDPQSIMFPYYKGYSPNFRLGYDDILAMYDLYVRAQFEDGDIDHNKENGDEIEPTSDDEEDSKNDGEDRYDPGHDEEENDADGHRDHEDDDQVQTTATSPPPPTTTTTPTAIVPDICDGLYDSMALLRGELFVFKDEYMWRFRERKIIQSGYPTKFRYMFDFPKPIARIDAAYENDKDGHIHFYSGRNVFTFDGMNFVNKYPHTLTDLGISSYVNKLDAAFIWGKNQKTYFLSGSEYWRYNGTVQKMDPNYPHGMSRWRGIPYPVDTAFKWKDGHTYFFLGKNFYRFNDKKVHVDEHYPLSTTQYWFGCLEEQQQRIQVNKHKSRHQHVANNGQQRKP